MDTTESAVENEAYKILWDFDEQTDHLNQLKWTRRQQFVI